MKVSPELCDLLERIGKRTEVPKKKILLEQGDVSRHAYYVESGCLRLWHNDDGNDVSIKFFLKGDLVASLESFYLNEPSKFGIEAIVPSVVRVATKQDFVNQIEQSPEFRSHMLTVSVHCMSDYQQLFLDRIKNNPEARYVRMTEESPDVLKIVPQYYIASYLGVTPVSLSRIRKKVGNN